MLTGKLILAAVTAGGLALAGNLALRKTGTRGITYFGPVLEEAIKTGSALFFNVSVPGTHILFGVLEAAGDYTWGGRQRITAALCGIAAHTIFGLTTYLITSAGYPVYTAVTASIAVHAAWNAAVLKLARRP
ncbi:MAG: hypothetical protein K6T66_02765 [Peptococcaceae bacterium]|nr:hypothetical protein [Peptococcaceae bacterium]